MKKSFLISIFLFCVTSLFAEKSYLGSTKLRYDSAENVTFTYYYSDGIFSEEQGLLVTLTGSQDDMWSSFYDCCLWFSNDEIETLRKILNKYDEWKSTSQTNNLKDLTKKIPTEEETNCVRWAQGFPHEVPYSFVFNVDSYGRTKLMFSVRMMTNYSFDTFEVTDSDISKLKLYISESSIEQARKKISTTKNNLDLLN